MAKKYLIRDAQTLREYAQKIKNPVFGIGTRPYNFTIGVYKLFRHFEILACKRIGKEIPLIEKKIKITFLSSPDNEIRTAKNNKSYTKKTPLDLLKSKKIIHYLNSFKEKPILLFNQMPQNLEKFLRKKGYIIVSSGFRMYHKYENKINFQKLLGELRLLSPQHLILRGDALDYDKVSKLIGKKFVIQLPDSALGAGTFFAFNKGGLSRAMSNLALREAINGNKSLRVTRFIEHTLSPSMTVCVTKFGILYTGLQTQTIDAQEVVNKKGRSGIYCGHEWIPGNFSPEVQRQAALIAERLGTYFKEEDGFRGIFGIDFILEKITNKLYPIEVNVRLLGSFPVLSMLQGKADQPLIQGLQIIDSLGRNDYAFDIQSLNKLMAKEKTGSHLNIYLKNSYSSVVLGNIRPGIYKIDKKFKKVNFSRDGVFFEDLKNKNEILLTGGIPTKGQIFEPHQNICKLISRGAFLNRSGKLNSFSKLMVKYVYRKIELSQVRDL